MQFGSNEDLHPCFFFNHKSNDVRFFDFSNLNKFIESGVVGHNGHVHVMCLTFKTVQNDTAQYINE